MMVSIWFMCWCRLVGLIICVVMWLFVYLYGLISVVCI